MKQNLIVAFFAFVLIALTQAAPLLAQNDQSEKIKIIFSDKLLFEGVLIDKTAYVPITEIYRSVAGGDNSKIAEYFKLDKNRLMAISSDKAGFNKDCGKKCLLLIGSGVISENIRRKTGADKKEQILVPLDDLAKAMEVSIKADAPNRIYTVSGQDPDKCKKCALALNPLILKSSSIVRPNAITPQ